MIRCRKLKVGAREVFTGHLWVSAFAEYAATLFFVFAVSGSSLRWEGTPSSLKISLAAGLASSLVTQAFRWVCKPLVHANPSVSFAAFLSGDTGLVAMAIYIVVQCFGAITGVALLRVMSPEHARGILGATIPASGTSSLQAVGTEAVLTLFLVLAVLATLDAVKYDPHARLDVSVAVGLATIVCYLIAVPLTGAGLNPARSLGPAVLSKMWESHWVYWCGPMVGAGVAGILYNTLLHSRSAWQRTDTYDSEESSLKP
ncbi:lens fiber major intrinsic protein [Exaiptasia diaphana]|uniref:Aquaporin n=1 Tax=Exaiptasia diaphana TaxID=2652724 RepID=A0A913XS87_EXADI|nr:lens fiber major intrinsic protein [Exaiptasia diaphana]KXJ09585.1 Lens fiber major intrinsic protein [Exaiptasia diaphana]